MVVIAELGGCGGGSGGDDELGGWGVVVMMS